MAVLEDLGNAVIDGIIQQGLVTADLSEPRVLIWEENAAQAIGELVEAWYAERASSASP